MILTFLNQKGGCGKSTTCFHLAGALAQAGKRVLLVDVDPQGSLSQGYWGSARVELLPWTETVTALFAPDGALIAPRQLIQATPWANVWLLPANQQLAPFNAPAPERAGLLQFALQPLVDDLPGFDMVLIDCPPNLYRCSWAALLAADYVVVPVPPEDFGTQGLPVVQAAIEQARRLNSRLELLGYLVTRAATRLVVHQTYERRLREMFGSQVFGNVIPEAAAFKLALACRQPVGFHAPRSAAAVVMQQFAQEMLDRMQSTARPARCA